MTYFSRLNSRNPLRRPWLVGVLALAVVPVLLFSAFLPVWAAPAALIYLLILFLLRSAAVSRILGHTPADLPLLLLLLILPVGLWASADAATTLPRTYAMAANLAVFGAVAAQRNTRWLGWSGWGLLIGALFLSLFLLPGTQFSSAKLPFINRGLYDLLPGGFRPFWNPAGFNANLTGGVLALFLPPAVMLALAGGRWFQRLLAAGVVLLLAAMLLLAQSRGALIGVAVAVPVILSLYDRRWAWFWWVVLVVALLAFALLGSDLPLEQILGSSVALGQNPLQGRIELWSRAIYMSQDFAFTGVGLGMFEPVVKLLYPTFIIGPEGDFRHPHNLFLQHSAEMGFPGLIALLALYFILAYLLLRRSRDAGAGVYRPLALGLFGALLAYLVHGLFEVITYAPRAAVIIWALFGLMAAVGTSTGASVRQGSGAKEVRGPTTGTAIPS